MVLNLKLLCFCYISFNLKERVLFVGYCFYTPPPLFVIVFSFFDYEAAYADLLKLC